MIDLHCHYLPGIDDGANTMEEAIALAEAAVNNGIRCAIMTPHLHPGRYENTKATIAEHVASFRIALEQAGIPLSVGFAAEVRLAPETLPLIESGQVPFLGEHEGYQIMLLEFPHSHIPLGADKLVQKLLDRKVRPLIAHPERNKDVMRNLDKITPFVEMGCLLQLTAASVANRFGENAHRRAVELLESDAPIILATDAHNLKARPPILREGMLAAAEIVGPQTARDMVYRLPRALVVSQFRSTPPQEVQHKSLVRNLPGFPGQDAKPKAQRNANPVVTTIEQQPRRTTEDDTVGVLPVSIEQFFKNRLLLDIVKELIPQSESSKSDAAQNMLDKQSQQSPPPEVRSRPTNSGAKDSSETYQEFKDRNQDQVEKELFFILLNRLKESEKLIGQMANLAELLKLVDSSADSSELIAQLLQGTGGER